MQCICSHFGHTLCKTLVFDCGFLRNKSYLCVIKLSWCLIPVFTSHMTTTYQLPHTQTTDIASTGVDTGSNDSESALIFI